MKTNKKYIYVCWWSWSCHFSNWWMTHTVCGSCFWHQSCTLAPSNEDEFLQNVNHSRPPHSSKIEELPPCLEQGVGHIFLLANLGALCRCRPFSCQAHLKVLFCHRPLASTFDEDWVRHKTALIRRHLQPCRPRFWSIAITNYCSHCMDSDGCKLQLIVLIVLAILTLQNSIFSIIFLKPNPSEAPQKYSNMLLAVNMWTSHVRIIYYHLTLKICSNHVFSLLKKICALNNNFRQWFLPQTIKSTCTAPSKKYPEFMNVWIFGAKGPYC